MSTKKKAVVKKAVAKKGTEKEVNALTEEVLNVVVGEVNEVLALNPAIGLDLSIDEKQTELKDCFELMTEQDCFTQGTVDVLKVLGCTVKVQIKPEKEKEEKEVATKKVTKKKEVAKKEKAKAPVKEKKEVVKKEKVKTEKVGVIASIVEFISLKPLTKEAIVEKLAKRFPDRQAESMAKTVNVQVGSRLKESHKIIKNEKGEYSIK